MNDLGIIILAAGKGTRMRSRTPKVLHKLGGISLLERVLNTAKKVSPDAQKVVVLRHEADLIYHTLYECLEGVDIARQTDVPGTGSGVLAGLKVLSENVKTVLVLSGDVPLTSNITLEHLLATYKKHYVQGTVASMLTLDLANPKGYGRIIREHGSVVGIAEEKDANHEQKSISEVNAGVYVFDTDFLRTYLPNVGTHNKQGEMYLTDLIGIAAKNGNKVLGLQIYDALQVEGVNDLLQLSKLNFIHNQKVVTKHLQNGVNIVAPESTWIEETVEIEPDVLIEPNCYISGSTKISSGAHILLGSRIIDATIGAGANVGPYAFLRPGAVLEQNSKAGGFVEVKNSVIGEGSKVPHLSYVGDAIIGHGTNIGAGSIFANYDGKNKHQTIVGNNVKVGANTTLIAPVTVGDNSYTGADAVVRKDVPEDALVYSENTLYCADGWPGISNVD